MSQQNIEVMQRLYALFRDRDYRAWNDAYDPEVELDVTAMGWPDAGRIQGLEGVTIFWRRWLGAWETYEYEESGWLDVGDEVLVSVRAWGLGKQSRLMAELHVTQVWTLRDRKIVRFRAFPSREEALEVLGLTG